MKIESLYIAGFGKFKDYRLILDKGLNVFYGQNEDGKTTILNFIKMMFYGSTTKVADLLKNPRKKYAPFDGSAMAGSIDFTHENTLYRIERNFGASNSSDKITLINLDTGERQAYGGTNDLGLKFFGLSAAAFERCVFIGQLNLGELSGDPSGELNSKLSSLVLTGEEDVSEKQVSARLLSAKEELMSKSGRKGRYDLIKAKIALLNEELMRSKQAEEQREVIALKTENQKKRFSFVLKEIDRATAELKATESKRNWKKLKDYIEALDDLNVFENKLIKADGNVLSISELSEIESAISKYKVQKSEIKELENQISNIKNELEKSSQESDKSSPLKIVEEKIAQENEKCNQLKSDFDSVCLKIEELTEKANNNLQKKATIRPVFLVMLLLGLGVLVSGFFLTKFSTLLFACGTALEILSLILLAAVRKKPKALSKEDNTSLIGANELKQRLSEEITDIREVISEQNKLLEALKAEQTTADDLRSEKQALLESLSLRFENTAKDITKAEEFFAFVFPKENMTASVSGMEIVLHAYKDYSRKVESCKTKLAILKADLGDLSRQAAEMKLAEIKHNSTDEIDPKQIEDQLSFKQKEAADIQKNIAYFEAEAKTAFSSFRHPTDIELEIAALNKTALEQKEFCESVDIALEALNSAFAQTRKDFSGVVEKRTCEIFAALTDGKYSNVSISKDFDIAVERSDIFGSREWQYLSSGTADQAYFALRLAVSEILSKECMGLPVMLDDAFAQYDDTRLLKALDFLGEYAKDNQVIYFTCHKAGLKEKGYNTLI